MSAPLLRTARGKVRGPVNGIEKPAAPGRADRAALLTQNRVVGPARCQKLQQPRFHGEIRVSDLAAIGLAAHADAAPEVFHRDVGGENGQLASKEQICFEHVATHCCQALRADEPPAVW